MKSPQSKLSRRNFLLAAGAGGASAAVALVTSKNGTPVKKEKTSSDAQGYRLTEHIRNYYRTAKV